MEKNISQQKEKNKTYTKNKSKKYISHEKQVDKSIKQDNKTGKKREYLVEQNYKRVNNRDNRRNISNKNELSKKEFGKLHKNNYANSADSDIKTKPAMYNKFDIDEFDDRSYDTDIDFLENVSQNETENDFSGMVSGRNAVRELLKSGRAIDKIFVRRGDREGSIVVIVAEAVNRKIPVIEVDAVKLDSISGHSHHQGVVAMAAAKEYVEMEDIIEIANSRGEKPLIVIADGIEDPYNLGALIRCAECAGAHGIIIPKRRASGLTNVVMKTSAGAIEHMAISKITNISSAIEKLKSKGIWVFAAETGGQPYYKTDFDVPAAIVFGSEGDGISRLVLEKCDVKVSIPMYGNVNSLNVSTAASVILCHAARIQHGDI